MIEFDFSRLSFFSGKEMQEKKKADSNEHLRLTFFE